MDPKVFAVCYAILLFPVFSLLKALEFLIGCIRPDGAAGMEAAKAAKAAKREADTQKYLQTVNAQSAADLVSELEFVAKKSREPTPKLRPLRTKADAEKSAATAPKRTTKEILGPLYEDRYAAPDDEVAWPDFKP